MTAQLMPYIVQKFFDANGNALAGGKLFTYEAGTTTPLATYTDQSGVTPNTNPVILDASGQASIWLGSGAYKFVLKDSANNIIKTSDNVSYINLGSIDKTMLNANVAGAALDQNGTGSLDVQVDDVSIEIVADELAVKSITPDNIPSTSKFEVIVKNVRDFSCPGFFNYIPQYPWLTPSMLSNPGTLPPAAALVAKWSPNGEYLAVGTGTSPYITIYQRQGSSLNILPSPVTTPPGQVNDISWSPCGDILALACNASSNNGVMTYQRYGSIFVSISNPGITASGHAFHLAFSPNGDFLAIEFNKFAPSATKFALWQFGGAPSSGAATITDVTTASTIPAVSSLMGGLSWTPDSLFLAGIDVTTDEIDVYENVAGIFFGITPPDVSAYAGDITGLSYSPDGNFLAVSLSVSPFILIFTSSGGVFAQLPNPATLPPGATSEVSWSTNSEYLAVCDSSGTSPYITIYQVTNPTSSPTFTKIIDPVSLPAGALVSADWTPTNQFLTVAGATTPYIQTYKTISNLNANALPWIREAPNV